MFLLLVWSDFLFSYCECQPCRQQMPMVPQPQGYNSTVLDLQDDSGLLCHGNNDLPAPPLAYVLCQVHIQITALVPLLIKLGFIEMMGRSTSSSHASFVLLQNYLERYKERGTDPLVHYKCSPFLILLLSFFFFRSAEKLYKCMYGAEFCQFILLASASGLADH